jgi:hypothetical protein
MIPYDQADKSDWVQIDVELDDQLIDSLKNLAQAENREISDLISKYLYEWWQNEISNGNLQEKYDKIEVKLPLVEKKDETDSTSEPHI